MHQRLDHCKKYQSALQCELAHQLIHNKNQPLQLRDAATNQQILTVDAYYNAFYNQLDYSALHKQMDEHTTLKLYIVNISNIRLILSLSPSILLLTQFSLHNQ